MLDLLRSTPLFSNFSESALRDLLPSVGEVRVPQGETLFRAGEAGEAFFVIVRGEIEVKKDGRLLTVLGAGALLGELAAFLGVRTADAVARTDATLCRIENTAFRDFLFAHPEESVRYLFESQREMAGRLARTSDFLVTVFETGRIVGGGLDLPSMGSAILRKLIERLPSAAGGLILLANPFSGEPDVVAAENPKVLDEPAAAELAGRSGAVFTIEASGGWVLGAPLADGERVLGAILLESAGSERFDSQEETIVQAVADQVALGILHAYHRQEEAGRRRLEQGRWRQG